MGKGRPVNPFVSEHFDKNDKNTKWVCKYCKAEVFKRKRNAIIHMLQECPNATDKARSDANGENESDTIGPNIKRNGGDPAQAKRSLERYIESYNATHSNLNLSLDSLSKNPDFNTLLKLLNCASFVKLLTKPTGSLGPESVKFPRSASLEIGSAHAGYGNASVYAGVSGAISPYITFNADSITGDPQHLPHQVIEAMYPNINVLSTICSTLETHELAVEVSDMLDSSMAAYTCCVAILHEASRSIMELEKVMEVTRQLNELYMRMGPGQPVIDTSDPDAVSDAAAAVLDDPPEPIDTNAHTHGDQQLVLRQIEHLRSFLTRIEDAIERIENHSNTTLSDAYAVLLEIENFNSGHFPEDLLISEMKVQLRETFDCYGWLPGMAAAYRIDPRYAHGRGAQGVARDLMGRKVNEVLEQIIEKYVLDKQQNDMLSEPPDDQIKMLMEQLEVDQRCYEPGCARQVELCRGPSREGVGARELLKGLEGWANDTPVLSRLAHVLLQMGAVARRPVTASTSTLAPVPPVAFEPSDIRLSMGV